MTRALVLSSALLAAIAIAACDIRVDTTPPGRTPGPSTTARSSLPVVTTAPSMTPLTGTVVGTTTPAIVASAGVATPVPTPTPDWNNPSGAPSYAPYPGRLVIISGNVYDEEGATVDGALVTVRSLDASVPYTATATTASGSYVINNLPEGANVEIMATKDGWTTRRRVASFQQAAAGQRNVIDFGGAGGPYDQSGKAYFISDRPEVARVEPADDATQVDPTRVSFKLTFSEPLPFDAQNDLAEAIVLWPANAEAGAPQAVDLEDRGAGQVDDGLGAAGLDFAAAPVPAAIGYQVREGDRMGAATVRATTSWNAEGTEVTFDFPAALQAGRLDDAKYQIGLVAGGEEVEDEDGNLLGTDAQGAERWPAAGRLVANVFREIDLALEDLPNAAPAAAAWAATHDSVSTFETRRDEDAPKLVGVEARDVGDDLRIELHFSEPMAAIDGTQDGMSDPELLGQADADLAVEDPEFLRNFTFAVGRQPGDLDQTPLDGLDGDEGTYDPTTRQLLPIGTEFAFDPAAVAPGGDLDEAQDGEIVVEVDPSDAKVVRLTIKGGAGLLGNVGELAARVAGVGDPAGNRISAAEADQNVVTNAL